MALGSPQGLRQRRLSDSAKASDHVDEVHVVDDRDEKPRLNAPPEEVVWGKTPSGEGTWRSDDAASTSTLNMSSNSLSRAYYPRCPFRAVSPCLPKKSSGHSQSISLGFPARPILSLAPVRVKNILPSLFCVLAGCVRCWSRLDSYQTEQEEVDRSRNPAIGMAGSGS